MSDTSREKSDAAPLRRRPWALHKLEWTLCLLLWTFGVLYAMYRASLSAIEYLPHLSSDDFDAGWTILGRPRDVSDYEWAVFSDLILSLLPLTACHVVASNLMKQILPEVLPYFYVAFSLASVVYCIGFLAALFLVFQIVLMYYIHLFKSKALCWIVSMFFLMCLNHDAGIAIKELMVVSDTREEYLLSVTIAWIICRCLSFCMVQCDLLEVEREQSRTPSQPADRNDLLLMLSYCLYFPLLYVGPLFMYDDFKRDLLAPPRPWPRHRICATATTVVRYWFWFLFLDFVLHFSYFSALNYHAGLAEVLPLWSLAGLAYGLCQVFMVKYTVMYGVSCTVANVEGFAVVAKPKCIARVHLYSDMWKYFDFGLYTFLKRYIYVPVIKDEPSGPKKFFAGFLCFAFVFVWHGLSERVFIWSLMNFVALTIENLGFHVATAPATQRLVRCHLSPFFIRRLRALLIAVLLMLSSISNFCFICGLDLTATFVRRIVLWGWPGPCCTTLAFLYCMCFVSEDIKLWESRKVS